MNLEIINKKTHEINHYRKPEKNWRKLMENLDPEGNPIVVMLGLR